MKTKSKVRSTGNGRKSVEIPKAVRDEFSSGEDVFITKADEPLLKQEKVNK